MSTRLAMSKSNPEKDQQQADKQQRLSQALRDNLYRRKQQARSRKDGVSKTPQSQPEDEDKDGRS